MALFLSLFVHAVTSGNQGGAISHFWKGLSLQEYCKNTLEKLHWLFPIRLILMKVKIFIDSNFNWLMTWCMNYVYLFFLEQHFLDTVAVVMNINMQL